MPGHATCEDPAPSCAGSSSMQAKSAPPSARVQWRTRISEFARGVGRRCPPAPALGDRLRIVPFRGGQASVL
eukprot:6051244-Alexandrium_andersonii.AAC.1